MGKPKIVCIDTNVAIWGVKGKATLGQEEMIHKARWLFQLCENDGTRILLPSVVVAEMLSGVPAAGRGKILEVCQRSFVIPAFDSRAALVYADLWPVEPDVRDALRQSGATRKSMKADCMIIATAVASKAEYLYSHDSDIRRLARGVEIEVRDLPEVPPEQLKLVMSYP